MSTLRSGGRARDLSSTSTLRPNAGAARPIPATMRADLPPVRPAVAPKARPDPRPMRIVLGMTGIAAASAIATALLAPAGTNAGAPDAGVTIVVPPPDPTAAPSHVTRIVQLKPGQTAPPQSVVVPAPTPKPRVVVVRTRQSGGKP